ncbi:MAG TPA: damage-inducible protein CinA, partial [Devosia sp.]|nr:damage-inducible protein CinA [Devosia sp.]
MKIFPRRNSPTMFDSRTQELARKVIRNLEQLEMSIVTAESCTGGLIGGALTAIP